MITEIIYAFSILFLDLLLCVLSLFNENMVYYPNCVSDLDSASFVQPQRRDQILSVRGDDIWKFARLLVKAKQQSQH